MAVLAKTIIGLAVASVKTWDGLALASLKALDGLDMTAAGGAIALIDFGSAGSANDNIATTGSISTTAGNFIGGVVSFYDFGGGDPTVSDDSGNTYQYRTTYASTFVQTRLFFCPSATLDGTVVVTATGTGTFPSIIAAVFSNVNASPYDVENGATAAAATSVQPGTATPSEDDELLICGFNGNLLNEDFTISGTGWAEIAQVNSDGAHHVAAALAYKVQTTAGAENPTWSWTTAQGVVSSQATFKAA